MINDQKTEWVICIECAPSDPPTKDEWSEALHCEDCTLKEASLQAIADDQPEDDIHGTERIIWAREVLHEPGGIFGGYDKPGNTIYTIRCTTTLVPTYDLRLMSTQYEGEEPEI